MDYGILINAVEEKKCLYDKREKNYKNIVIKEAAWEEIANVTGMSKEVCKKRWNLLREKFNKEQKNLDLASGSGAPQEERWIYMESMMFLKNIVQPRKTKSNHFGEEQGYESQADSVVPENSTPPPKRTRDAFADTCNVFKEAIEGFSNRQAQATLDPNDHFLLSIKGLMKDLPEDVKGQCRIDMLSFITNLRNQHLSN